MKNPVLVLSSVLLLSAFSCKKSSDGNKSIIVEENVEKTVSNDNGKIDSTFTDAKTEKTADTQVQEITERYVGTDGTSALVTFKNSDKEHTISIRSNNKTIVLPQKEAWAKGGIYADHDIEVKSEGDNITITQGNNVIELKKARGQ
ncbi:hypothetical protein MTP09_12345 [Chryseobacterium suipulveris]|uniref:Membrane-bound lysozyme-inhibitor of c-type lysozyme n=1 Tax=Chryseobacterium suipulveris TaxID=2929800 RepID=A0ABY4BS91_9FLAO|nr:hypothetical protein [Chryseobacterium suipulveris]UOE40681.1 hypothetical protein MTP09_12345 [Chryseobacterium suipulveris]